MISPVFSSIVASFGASLPSVNFVPSGTVVSFPSLSFTFGVTFVSSPTFPVASGYSGVYLSASFSVAFTTFNGTLSTCPSSTRTFLPCPSIL